MWGMGGGRKEKKILPKVGSGGLPSAGNAGAEPLKHVVFDGKRESVFENCIPIFYSRDKSNCRLF